MKITCAVCGARVDLERERERVTGHVCGSGPTRRLRLRSLGRLRDPASRERNKVQRERRRFNLGKASSRG